MIPVIQSMQKALWPNSLIRSAERSPGEEIWMAILFSMFFYPFSSLRQDLHSMCILSKSFLNAFYLAGPGIVTATVMSGLAFYGMVQIFGEEGGAFGLER